jgi:transposase-like protein
VTVDKSGSNLAALQAINAERETPIKIRQCKYLNNIVEEPMLGFKDFRCARIILSGIEVMHMIKKRQLNCWAKAHCLPPSSSTRTFHT